MSLAQPRRVTIVAPKARVDVSLPPQSTVVELIPQLVRMCGLEIDPSQGPASWELSRLGSAGLSPDLTVEAVGLHDGELLYLNHRDQRPAPLVFDDVVDAIANAAAQQSSAWSVVWSRRVGLAFAAIILGGAGLILGLLGPPGVASILATSGLALALLVVGGALARAYGDAGAGAALAAAGLPNIALAGANLVSSPVNPLRLDAAQLAVACAALAFYSVLVIIVVVDQSAWFVGVAASAGIGGLATTIIILTQAEATSAAALVVVLTVALSPVLPNLALRMGKLPLPRVPTDVAAFRRDESPTLGPAVAEDTRSADRLLTGLLGAVAIVVTVSAIILLRAGSAMAWLLASLAGLALVLRSRAFLSAPTRLSLLVAGSGALIATAGRVSVQGSASTRMVIAAGAVVLGAICAAYAARALNRSVSPYWSRLLDILEFITLISLVPVSGAVLGLYSAVRDWIS